MLNKLKERVDEFKVFNKKKIFTIATTSKIEEYGYLTPIRETNDFVISGCVIFEKTILKELLKILDGNIDIILVDQEKKVPLRVAKDNSNNLFNDTTIKPIDTGNLFKVCFNNIHKSKVYGFKPNDITVNAVWSFLNYRMYFYNKKKILIIGAGNIGSKLALKTVECGASVHIYGKNQHKTFNIEQGLNYIKPKNTISKIESSDDLYKAAFMADVVIGATNGVGVIDDEILNYVKKDCLIVDLGKNNITPKGLEFALDNELEIYRVDVTSAFEGYVYELLKTIDILENSYGKKEINGLTLVSGGYFGKYGDIIVDNINNPTKVFGMSNGKGALKSIDNNEIQIKINKILEK